MALRMYRLMSLGFFFGIAQEPQIVQNSDPLE
ncbi:hypothetical protein TB1_039275 [Malus domestica]